MKIIDCPDIPESLHKCFVSKMCGIDSSNISNEYLNNLDLERPCIVDRTDPQYIKILKEIENNKDFDELLEPFNPKSLKKVKINTKTFKKIK